MSRQYNELVQLLPDQHVSTEELKTLNHGKVRSDLIGDNDIA